MGALAIALSFHKRYLDRRMSNTLRHNVIIRSQAQGAREAERQRIAADFHDGPLQSFISFQMRLEIVKKLLARDVDAAAEELRQLQELCRSQVGELRSFVRSMRPADEGVSLPASLSRMVDQFQRDTGISATFSSGDFHDPAETEVSLELLQIVRETLNNIQKHSGATRIAMSARNARPSHSRFGRRQRQRISLQRLLHAGRAGTAAAGPGEHQAARAMLGGESAARIASGAGRQPANPDPGLKYARLGRFIRGVVFLSVPCGRYADFTLPAARIGGPQRSVHVVGDRRGRCIGPRQCFVDVLNPSVVRFHGRVSQSVFRFRWPHLAHARRDFFRRRPLAQAGPRVVAVAAGKARISRPTDRRWFRRARSCIGMRPAIRPRIALARSAGRRRVAERIRTRARPGPRGSFDERGVADPYVIRAGRQFYLFYLGQDRARRQRMGVARSRDGVPLGETAIESAFSNWASWRIRRKRAGRTGRVVVSGGAYWMLYTGRDREEHRHIGLAKSPDGVHWARDDSFPPSPEPRPGTAVVCDPTVEVMPDQIRVWFGGGDVPSPDQNLHGQIGLGILK